jgi:hypothetical protein
MRMLHAAKLANAQALAFKLQMHFALRIALAGLQAFGRIFVRLGHGPVAGNVFFCGLVQFSRSSY